MQVENQGQPEIWNDQKDPLKEDEELEFDSSAYEMLHRSQVEWPCLSLDILLPERATKNNGADFNHKAWFPSQMAMGFSEKDCVFDKRLGVNTYKHDTYPKSVYFCAGSQAEPEVPGQSVENKIYVMKWSEMEKTLHDDDEPSDNSEDDEEDIIEKINRQPKEPVIRYETIPHRGCVNRIRSLHGSSIVATWSDTAEVGIYNLEPALDELEKPIDEAPQTETTAIGKKKKKKNVKKKKLGGTKLFSHKHANEGFAIEWSPLSFGRLATGSCDAKLFVYQPADETCSSFVPETKVGLQGHKGSIEDIQWSPAQSHVLATCSVDQTIKLWDLRATAQKSQMSFKAHDSDVNVMSWNKHTTFLLASGDDNGEFRIWDLRRLNPKTYNQESFESITRIRWHTKPITSLQFEPREESVLAVASDDNKLTLWDFSVEEDEQEQKDQKLEANGMDIPPQLMFLHQGQNLIKELRFHPQFRTTLFTTAMDSFNVFRPNLDPDYEAEQKEEESKEQEGIKQGTNFTIDEEEDSDEEERRVIKAAKQLNEKRRSKSKGPKRRKHE